MRKRSGAAALVMAVALAVAGCGSDSQEPSSPEPEPKRSEEKAPASPTPTEEANDQAAIEAIKTWIDTSNEVRRTLDTAAVNELESLSTKECHACGARMDEAREFAKSGGGYEGDFEEEYRDFRVTEDASDEDELQILVKVRNGDWRSTGEGGSVQDMAKAAEHETRFYMRWEGDQWLVGEVFRENG